MRKKLTKHGNSLALLIDKPVLELLNIGENDLLEITTDGQALVLTPVKNLKRMRKFKKALETVNRKYGGALKRLAE